MHNDFEKVRSFYFKIWPGLIDENWATLEKQLTVKQYKKGSVILKPGEVCNDIGFINSGLVRIYYDVNGKEVITSFFDEGASFANYQSFLSRGPSLTYIDVLEDTEIVNIGYDTLQYAYEHLSDSERVGRLMAEHLFIMLSARNASLLLESPEQRYVNFLKERPGFLQRVPQYMIASYLGVTPEALSRIRSRLNKKNEENV